MISSNIWLSYVHKQTILWFDLSGKKSRKFCFFFWAGDSLLSHTVSHPESNLDKFIMFEQRDPFAERQKRDDPFECDWDRFAYIEYNRLAQEEEAREEMELDGAGVSGGGDWGEGWGGSVGGAEEAPF